MANRYSTFRSFSFLLSCSAWCGTALLISSARAEDMPSIEEAASRLQAATVTVRVSLDGKETMSVADSGDSNGQVTVCSGVSLGNGLVVTSVFAAADSRIRVTLPGGDQASAKLQVIDDYTSLALLQLDRRGVPGMEMSEATARVGSWVVSAAAWGAEDAVVSFGIVAGVDRMLDGGLPPLLQCDLRSDDTSAGAGVVDRDGKLLGIVVGVDRGEKGRGWTYAVPVRHVRRLLNARSESLEHGAAIILKRRRPTIGMVLEGDEGDVVVRRVQGASAAERAGIKEGDRIIAADGVNIRSVYQAVRPVLNKQPGDEVEFLVQQRDGMRRIRVVLDGGVELPAASLDRVAQFVRPSFEVRMGDGYFVTRTGRGEVRDVIAPATDDQGELMNVPERVQLLERAAERYLNVIVHLRDELGRREAERLDAEQKIEALQKEIAKLKQNVESARKP